MCRCLLVYSVSAWLDVRQNSVVRIYHHFAERVFRWHKFCSSKFGAESKSDMLFFEMHGESNVFIHCQYLQGSLFFLNSRGRVCEAIFYGLQKISSSTFTLRGMYAFSVLVSLLHTFGILCFLVKLMFSAATDVTSLFLNTVHLIFLWSALASWFSLFFILQLRFFSEVSALVYAAQFLACSMYVPLLRITNHVNPYLFQNSCF